MTHQADTWGSEFGDEYTIGNPATPQEMEELYLRRFGITRTAMNAEFLDDLPRSARILEIGANVGLQLNLLAGMGFENLYGVEVTRFAVERSHSVCANLPVYTVQGSALDIPFKDGFFDIVFTSGLLIHIHPDHIAEVMREMSRCTSRYIWGFEYFADEGYVEIPYRGQRDLLWKTDFAKVFLEACPELSEVASKKWLYLDEPGGLEDKMYLLEKTCE